MEGLDAHEFSPTKAYATVDDGMSPKPKVPTTAKVAPVDNSGAASTGQ